MIVSLALLIILILLLSGSIYILFRNDKVFKFCRTLIEYSYEYSIRRVNELNFDYEDPYDWFACKHTYDRMLFSFKPLKLEYWFTKEELEEIKK